MSFSISDVAREYVYKRFPRASIPEKEKYVRDWSNKIEDSKSLTKDFKGRVADPSGKKVIDVGCGNGGISIAFALSGADVYGVEIEEELYQISIKHAESFNVKPNFYLYDGSKLPFEDNYFDFGVSVSVLEHTDDPVFYLSEILRVLKPGGSLYLGFPNKLFPKETHTGLFFLTYLPAFMRPLYIKLFHRNPLEDNNLHFYSYFGLERMLNNIKIESKSESHGYFWSIVKEEGHSKNVLKKGVKKLISLFGLNYKAFLPHVLVILKKEKI